jgi:hypothetical protein
MFQKTGECPAAVKRLRALCALASVPFVLRFFRVFSTLRSSEP